MAISQKRIKAYLLALKGCSTKPHFGAEGFYAHKRIFATFWNNEKKINLRLSREEQKRFLIEEGFTQINNAWGKQGWTEVSLGSVEPEELFKAIDVAWKLSAVKKKLKKKIRRL